MLVDRRLGHCTVVSNRRYAAVLVNFFFVHGGAWLSVLSIASIGDKPLLKAWAVVYVWCFTRTEKKICGEQMSASLMRRKTHFFISLNLCVCLSNGSSESHRAALSVAPQGSLCGFTLVLGYQWKYPWTVFSCIHTFSRYLSVRVAELWRGCVLLLYRLQMYILLDYIFW